MKNTIDHIGKFLEGKGFYITLSLCLVLSLVVGYITFGTQSDLSKDQDPTTGIDVAQAADGLPEAGDVPELDWQAEGEIASANAQAQPESSEPEDDGQADEAAPVDTQVELIEMPVEGTITVKFAMEDFVYSDTMKDWRTHNGVDINAAEDEPVRAVADGTVTQVYEDTMMGMTVVIEHQNGMKRIYANLSPEVSVSEGQQVETGYVIGAVGASAASESKQEAHLHFSLLKGEEYINPVNLFAS